MSWLLQQVQSKHFHELGSSNPEDNIRLLCPAKKCGRGFHLEVLQRALLPSDFETLSYALSLKACQSSADMFGCPDAGCRGMGFVGDATCAEEVECGVCGKKWKLAGRQSVLS